MQRIFFLNLPNEDANILALNSNIGDYYVYRKQYRKAIQILQENINLIEAIGLSDQYLNGLENALQQKGVAYRELGMTDSAFYFFAAAEKYKSVNSSTFTALSKAITYLKLNQPKAALELINEIEADRILYTNLTIGQKADFELQKGKTLLQLQDYYQAIKAFQKGINILIPDYPPDTEIGLQPKLDKNTEAPIILLELLQAKGQALQQKSNTPGFLTASLETYLSAIDWIDSLKEGHLLEKSTLAWGSTYRQVYEEGLNVTHQLYSQEPSQTLLNTAFILSEKSKANLLLEAFATQSALHQSNIPEEILNEERNLGIDIAYYEKASLSALEAKDTLKAKLFQSYVSEKHIELAHLKAQMQADYPDYFQLKYAQNQLNIETIQQNLLNERKALVAFFIGQESAFVFVIRSQEAQMHPIPLDSSFHQKLERFKTVLIETGQFSA